jgi:hypothetical protein
MGAHMCRASGLPGGFGGGHRSRSCQVARTGSADEAAADLLRDAKLAPGKGTCPRNRCTGTLVSRSFCLKQRECPFRAVGSPCGDDPGSPDDRAFFAKVSRGGLSMGNLRDGGRVIIGVDDAAPAAMLPGLGDDDLAAWLEFDTISVRLAEYADPPLRIEVYSLTLSTGAQVVVLEVEEFAEVPHLCAKSYEPTLLKGALYVRTRRMPETAEVPTQTEMRELLDLATEKRLRAYVESAERAGVSLGIAREAEVAEAPANAERYEEQIDEAWDE